MSERHAHLIRWMDYSLFDRLKYSWDYPLFGICADIISTFFGGRCIARNSNTTSTNWLTDPIRALFGMAETQMSDLMDLVAPERPIRASSVRRGSKRRADKPSACGLDARGGVTRLRSVMERRTPPALQRAAPLRDQLALAYLPSACGVMSG